MFNLKVVSATVLACAASMLLISPIALKSGENKLVHPIDNKALLWEEFHAVEGKCKMKFPVSPEHISEKMNATEEGYDLKYDAYISQMGKHAVFMLLVAQYPDFVDESYAHMSLESFLNGILTNNPGNQLLFADLVLVDGHEALDFFIRTGSMYFKGRAMMIKNQLYLMAMECEVQHYDEGNYNLFVNSFKKMP